MHFSELGIFSIIISWIAFTCLLSKWKSDRTMSLSMHAADDRSAYFFFAAMLTLVTALFYIFMFKWFIPEFKLSSIFSVTLTLTYILQFVSAWVPDVKGIKRGIHRLFAYTFAFFLLLLSLQIIFFIKLTIVLQLVGGFSIVFMCLVWMLFLFVKKARRHYLFYQVGYIICFQLFILAVTYLN